jgi:hypothetical protein
MLGPGIALPAALFGTLKLLVQALAAPPPLACGAVRVGRVCPIPAVSVVAVIQVKPVYVLVVGPAARTAPLVLGLLLDIVRRQRLGEWRHGLGGSRCRPRGVDFTRLGSENRSHVPANYPIGKPRHWLVTRPKSYRSVIEVLWKAWGYAVLWCAVLRCSNSPVPGVGESGRAEAKYGRERLCAAGIRNVGAVGDVGCGMLDVCGMLLNEPMPWMASRRKRVGCSDGRPRPGLDCNAGQTLCPTSPDQVRTDSRYHGR